MWYETALSCSTVKFVHVFNYSTLKTLNRKLQTQFTCNQSYTLPLSLLIDLMEITNLMKESLLIVSQLEFHSEVKPSIKDKLINNE
jgi:hypothetical protein